MGRIARTSAGPDGMSADQRDDRFVELLSAHQARLRAYIFALLRDVANVDDVLQDAYMALWSKRAEYDATRDFFRWACGMAIIEVLRFRRKAATDRLLFDEALIQTLAADFVEQGDVSDLRRAALPACLQKLGVQERALLESRYRQSVKVEDLAGQFGKPVSTMYRMIAKAREQLFACVQRAIARESPP
jgi:RNA polymerase sigma-70 factor (ECF subfamily)